MSKPDILDEIIHQLAPDQIPTEYIIMAKVRTYDGMEKIVTGEQLEVILNEHAENVADVRVILDVKRIRSAIVTETNRIFAAVHSL